MSSLDASSGDHSRTMILLQKAKEGSQGAFDELFSSVEARLVLYIRMRYRTPGQVGAREDYEDILQRTYIEALRAFPTYQYQGPGSFYRWMREIARLVIARTFDTHRKAKRRSTDREVPMDAMPSTQAAGIQGPGRAMPSTPSRKVYVGQKLEALSRALEQLPDHYREVVILHKIEEQTFAETARKTGRTEAACKMIYFRAMGEMRNILQRDKGMEGATEML